MNFDEELAQLERRRRWLRRAAWTLVPLSLLALGVARAFYPGPFGAGYLFDNIQVPSDLLGLFRQQGVDISLFPDRMFLGMRTSMIQAVINLIRLALLIVGVGSLLRLQPRWALGCGLVWFVLGLLSQSWMSHSGYMVAPQVEFGVRRGNPPPAPDSVVTPRKPTDTVPTFAEVSRKLGSSDERINQIHAEINARAQGREQRVIRLRAMMENPQGFPGYKMGQLHYIAAQIGYLEDDKASVQRHLSALLPAEFFPTWDSDYRLRIMQEWLAKKGVTLRRAAYRPITGMPFAVARMIAGIFALLGMMLLMTMILLVHLGRKLGRRLERMQGLLLNMEISPAPSPASRPGQFGKRVNPMPATATNSLARRG